MELNILILLTWQLISGTVEGASEKECMQNKIY